MAGFANKVSSIDMRSGGVIETDGLEPVTDRMFDDAGGCESSNPAWVVRTASDSLRQLREAI